MIERKLRAVVAVLACVSAGCGEGAIRPGPLDAPIDELDTLDSEIVNGKVDHKHPSVGKLREAGRDICTATLIGARTVLCAAHCITQRASAYSFVLGAKAYPAESVIVHPGWDAEAAEYEGLNDLSVVLLRSAPQVKPTPIATRAPRAGQNLTLVGFGVTGEEERDYGTKRVTYNSIDRVGATKIYWAPVNGIGTTCYGDSGGPAFVDMDGEEVQVGITSGGERPCEAGYAWDTRVDRFASWIRSVAEGDVVVQGEPGGASATSAPDTEKPHVHIRSPKSQSTVRVGDVVVESTATDETGVVKAELWVDGEYERMVTKAPYRFKTRLSTGTHQLRVYGYDAAGNVGRYTVTVKAR
ncbi:MAG: trypsin-like serine protease [Deltaproteobacteria bacterium]|nr:trypsin-like serine protease [Deltaproteobacteria bacterium]